MRIRQLSEAINEGRLVGLSAAEALSNASERLQLIDRGVVPTDLLSWWGIPPKFRWSARCTYAFSIVTFARRFATPAV
jgi:hypothetical protein